MNLTNTILPSQPTDDLMSQLVSYIQQLAQKHLYVNGFFLGERYNENVTNIRYPLVQMILPVDSSIISGTALPTLQFSIQLRFTANGYLDFSSGDLTNPVLKQISRQSETLNIDYTTKTLDIEKNKLIIFQQFNIGNNFLAKIREDYNNGDSPFQLASYSIRTVTREANDDVNGVVLDLGLSVLNPYICGVSNYFTNIIN